ncbi:MAG TPA: DUF1858 domain-containing protein [Anaerolineaceae bacterium]|jgi:hybrid cluster-associated redox disulfide protein|nr:DUF1858 domain-containing protein [Anaerolineaceae bacterium]
MTSKSIDPSCSVADLLHQWPATISLFLERRMACVGCSMAAFETLEDAARIYKIQPVQFLQDLEQIIQNSSLEEIP